MQAEGGKEEGTGREEGKECRRPKTKNAPCTCPPTDRAPSASPRPSAAARTRLPSHPSRPSFVRRERANHQISGADAAMSERYASGQEVKSSPTQDQVEGRRERLRTNDIALQQTQHAMMKCLFGCNTVMFGAGACLGRVIRSGWHWIGTLQRFFSLFRCGPLILIQILVAFVQRV